MSVSAFVGHAGVGKTYNLFLALGKLLQSRPLLDGQRVLGLTFMHGSRQRLDEQLRKTPAVKGRYACMTVDRFAWQLCRRWRSLLRKLQPKEIAERDYEGTCDSAGLLLENDVVRNWVAATYPVVVLDEAQDLSRPRLRIMHNLERSVSVLAAADEFQCLKPELMPNPAVNWLNQTCRPQTLTVPRRTDRRDLLKAAVSIRDGKRLVTGSNFKILSAPGKSPYFLAATCVANAIKWSRGGDIAIITPARSAYVTCIVEQVSNNSFGKDKQVGPYPIQWEQAPNELAKDILDQLALPKDGEAEATLKALAATQAHPAVGNCVTSMARHQSLSGCKHFSREQVQEYIEAAFSQHRRYYRGGGSRLRAMTVQQAKNREFDGVIVLWPYATASIADEQQRRLLYNAITRAKLWCTVVVQDKKMLDKPPYAPRSA